jgi:DNA replication and repair protein RecF
MYLNQLEIQKFRNLKPIRVTFSPLVNFIFGDNAQGKTNLVEAIYILCLAKSFRTREDAEIVPFSDQEYFIEGEFHADDAIRRRIAVMYDAAQGKQISIDEKRLHRFSNLIGEFPVICLSAGDHEITSGAPVQRRRFFNILLSQSSRRYLDDLKQYEKIVRQRNTILTTMMSGKHGSDAQLEIWNQQLISFGARLITARREMVDELNTFLAEYYQILTRNRWSLRIDYHPNVAASADDVMEEKFEQQLRKWAPKEKSHGVTLVGPHRDEFKFLVSDRELRLFGSRGEHKSALVSLKAAEAAVLQKRTEIRPIILLDDLYAELDSSRCANVLALFEKNRQIFITGAHFDSADFNRAGISTESAATFFVDNGAISKGDHAAFS